jgi:hypothetical protein
MPIIKDAMIIRILTIALLFSLPDIAISQQAVSAAGSTSAAQNIELSYTLGECFITQQSAGALTNAQGFQQPEIPQLQTKLFLQGFYAGSSSMLAVANPLNMPQYTDTVTLSLIAGTPPYSILWTKSVLLKTDGTLAVWLPAQLYRKNTYLKINHRNHLETWSKTPHLLRTFNTIKFSDL